MSAVLREACCLASRVFQLVFALAASFTFICPAAYAVEPLHKLYLKDLSPQAQEVARDLGITGDIEKLLEAMDNAPDEKPTLETLDLRSRLLEKILISEFEIRNVLSKIDQEATFINELRDVLEDSRETRVQKNAVANFMITGSFEILAAALELGGEGMRVPATLNAMLGNIAQVGISAASLRLVRGERVTDPVGDMLIPVLTGHPDPRYYPESIWEYVTDPNVPGGPTRVQQLIDRWVRLKKVEVVSTKSGTTTIRVRTAPKRRTNTNTIASLEDRALMLADVRALISQMDGPLLEILLWIRR